MKEFEKLEALLKSKSFRQLNEEEQTWVTEELGDEKNYENLRQMLTHLSQEKTIKMRSRIKKDLVLEFQQKHQTSWKQLFTYRIPVVAGVLIWVFLSFGLFYLLPDKEVTVEKRIPVENIRVDTLFVHLPADTVFIEKTVRVEVPVILPEPIKEELSEPVLVKGNSLSEQRVLQRLLVSGEDY